MKVLISERKNLSGVCLAILCEIKYVVDYQVKREKRNYF
jgi:hypothetical protein